METLTTDRLQLRPFTAADADALTPILADAEGMQYSLMAPKSREETRAALGQILSLYEKEGFGLYAVVHRAEAKLIGYCGFVVRQVDGEREIELGSGLARAYWGQGLATEAARACRDYAFATLGFRRLISIVDPRNIASIRVAEKLGMNPEKEAVVQGVTLRIYGVARGSVSTLPPERGL